MTTSTAAPATRADDDDTYAFDDDAVRGVAAVADMFGTTEGFRTTEPKPVTTAPVPDDEEEEDF